MPPCGMSPAKVSERRRFVDAQDGAHQRLARAAFALQRQREQ